MRRFLMMFSCVVLLSFAWAIPAVHGQDSMERVGSFTFLKFDASFPGAVNTDGLGINNLGQVVGEYYNGIGNIAQGYLRSPEGDFTKIDVPATLSGGSPSTFQWAIGLNNAGVIVGRYRSAGFFGARGDHCYVLSGGVFTSIDVPIPGTFGTRCRGINDSGQIAGFYFDPAFNRHGFLLSGGGFTTFDFPGSVNTFPRRINNSGQIVGEYLDGNRLTHGFLLSGGSFTPIDVPGALETDVGAINNAGEIVGAYRDTDNHMHAFQLAGGAFTTIRLPGVIQNTNGPVLFDLNDYVNIWGINDAGVITGTFLGRDGNFHGFIGVPGNPDDNGGGN